MSSPPDSRMARPITFVDGAVPPEADCLNVDASLEVPSLFAVESEEEGEEWFSASGYIISNPFRADGFGSIADGLANGILIDIVDNTGALQVDVTGGSPIRYFADFAKFGGISAPPSTFVGATMASIDIPLLYGVADRKRDSITIPRPGWQLRIIIRDDLSSIARFCMNVNGRIADRRS